MEPAKRASFFAMPSLGGKLAMVNINLWVIGFLLMRSKAIPEWLVEYLSVPFAILFFFLALPIGVCVLLPSLGPPTMSAIVWVCAVLGINAFLWGYGLAWIWDKAVYGFRKKKREPTSGEV